MEVCPMDELALGQIGETYPAREGGNMLWGFHWIRLK